MVFRENRQRLRCHRLWHQHKCGNRAHLLVGAIAFSLRMLGILPRFRTLFGANWFFRTFGEAEAGELKHGITGPGQ